MKIVKLNYIRFLHAITYYALVVRIMMNFSGSGNIC